MAQTIRIKCRTHTAEQRKPGSVKLVMPGGTLVNAEMHEGRIARSRKLNKKQRIAARRAGRAPE